MRLLFSFLLMLFVVGLSAQTYLVITGKVIDADNKKPLGFAHVGIPEKGIGTVTGMDGDFTLKIPTAYAQSTLVVSYMGYKDYRNSIQAIKSPATIQIKASPTNFMEVVVMDERGVQDIIRRAVRAIPKNYPTHPITNLGFYRESRTDAAGDYMYLAEGVLNIYKTSYKQEKEGQVSLVQGRKILLQPEKVENDIGFASGHLAADRFDFVKYRDYFLDEKKFSDYSYRLEKITTYQDLPVYVIGFDRSENGRGRLKGKVYIDTLSYAFIRAEYEVRPEAQRAYEDYPLYVGNWKRNSYTVNYRKFEDKWYFGDALREGVYKDGGTYSNEIMITEINPKRSDPIPYEQRLGRGSNFLNSTGAYDEDFWKQYNTSPLSQKLEESVLQAKNEAESARVFDQAFMQEMQRLQDSIKQLKAQPDFEEDEDFEMPPIYNENGRAFRSSNNLKVQFALGAGTHLLSTEAASMRLAYLNAPNGEPLLSVTNDWKNRDVEPIFHTDLRVFFRKNFFFTGNLGWDLWDSYYRQRGVGVGAQANLSQGRPFFVRASVEESSLRYARLVGDARNDSGTFKPKKKKFNADEIGMYYGSQAHSLKFTLELALEKNPSQEYFIRGGYMLPFSRKQILYLKERQFFSKKEHIPLSSQIEVEQNGQPFTEALIPDQSFFITVGILFK